MKTGPAINPKNQNVVKDLKTLSRIITIPVLLVSFSLIVALPAAAQAPGSLDPSFDTDGKVTTSFGGYQAISQAVAVQSDGKIVVGGVSYTTISTGDFALTRYNPDGSLDSTFGTGGKATTSFGLKVATIWGLAIYKSGPHVGKIVAAGDTTASGLNVFALARYNTDGSLDPTFGGGTGKVTTGFALSGDINVTSQALSVAIQSDDRIVLAGNTVKGFNPSSGPQDSPANNGFNFALARYNADGTLDTSFGGTGKVITDIGGFSFGGGDGAYAVAIQSDGKIVAAGNANPLASGNADFAVVRYNINGTLDTTFGVGGKVTTDFGSVEDYVKSVGIQSDGKIVVTGSFGSYPWADFALARYNTNGMLDTTFGFGGKVTTSFGGWDLGQAMAIQSDGGIVAAGHTQSASYALDFAVARYNPNGSLDTSFATGGKVTTDFGGGPDAGHAVAIQSDGKIVVAGSGGVATTVFAVARFGGTVPLPSNIPPTAVAGPDQTVAAGVNCNALVQLSGTGSDPENGLLTFTWSGAFGTATGQNPSVTLPLGNNTVTLTVTDNMGAAATATVVIHVVDNTAPSLTVPAGVTAQNDLGKCGANVSFSVTASDNCSRVSVLNTPASGSFFPVGTTTVTSVATDESGNPTTKTFTVTVTDTEKPKIVANGNIVANAAPGGCAANVNLSGAVTATDNCAGVSVSFIPAAGTAFAKGETIVTATATDAAGNTATTTFKVTVLDVEPPTFLAQAVSKTVECDGAGNAAAISAWLSSRGGASATDSCGPVTWTNNYHGLTAACGATGAATVVFTAMDSSGNSATTTATFTIVDTTAPTIVTGAVSATIESDGAGNTAALNAWLANKGGAAASDLGSSVTWSNNFNALTKACGATGSATVTFTATDACGHASTTTATFTIVDTTKPVIVAAAANKTVETDGAGNVAALSAWLASNGGGTATDGSGTVKWSNNYTGTTFVRACGTTGAATVTFTAMDECGNKSPSTATFTIVDTGKPTLASNVRDISPNEKPTTFTITSADTGGGSTPSIVNVTATRTNPPGKTQDKTDPYKHTVSGNKITIESSGGVGTVWTIYASGVDDCGNIATEQFVIHVVNPTLTK